MSTDKLVKLTEELNEIEAYKIVLNDFLPLTDYNDKIEQELLYCKVRTINIEKEISELKAKDAKCGREK